jgi:hypothetical protein
MVETLSLRPLFKMQQAYDSPFGEAIAETRFSADGSTLQQAFSIANSLHRFGLTLMFLMF